jgi:hypothetical protein
MAYAFQMAISRRAVLSSAVAFAFVSVCIFGSCAADTENSADSRRDYLLPILRPGESMRLSNSSNALVPLWFHKRPGRKPFILRYPPTVIETRLLDPKSDDSDAPPLTPDYETTINGRNIRVFEKGVWVFVDFPGGKSIVVNLFGELATSKDIAEPLRELTISAADEVVMTGWTEFKLQSQGKIIVSRNDAEVGELWFAKPFPSTLSLKDRFPDVSEITDGPDKISLVAIPSLSPEDLGWIEPDGLEVWLLSRKFGLSPSASVSEARPLFRRVSKDEWDRAVGANPDPPPSTEPPDVSRIVRNSKIPIPAPIEFADDFMGDPDGETKSMKWDIRIVGAVPVDAATAAMYRANERLAALQIDGKETTVGDFSSMFEEEPPGLTSAGGRLQSEPFLPEARLAVMRIIREELAFAGVTEARISSAVLNG